MNRKHLQFTKDNFFVDGLLNECGASCVLEENDKGGESRLTVRCAHDTISLCNCDKKKTDIGFLRDEKCYGMKKRVDHIIFENTL